MRFVLMTSLCLLPAAGFAASDGCEIAGEIADRIVAERKKGTALYPAMEAVAADYEGSNSAYVEIIPGFADWIYSLPEGQAGPGIAQAVVAQCEAKATR